MIEAMACGTPVLAFRCGSVPEIVDERRHRLHRRQRGGGDRQLPRVLALDRRRVRRRFEERFTATRMAKDYLQVYRTLMKRPSLLPDVDADIDVTRPLMEAGLN